MRKTFAELRDEFELTVAAHAALVRLSLSAGGSRYLTEQIDLAAKNMHRAKMEMTAFVDELQ